jgi:hypothetical protein
LEARDVPSFLPPVLYPGGGNPFDLAVADLNGDGRPDVVTAGSSTNAVAVFLGNGDGTLQTPPALYGTGKYPIGVAVADLNGDGKPDLVTANGSGHSVSVLLNNGNGTFQPAKDFGGLNDYPFKIAVGDVDGDHIPDVAVSDYNGPYLWVLHGNGDGTLARPKVVLVPTYSQGVRIADLDHDGVGDIIVDSVYASVTVVYSSGAVVSYPVPGGWGNTVADLNGDGWPDLVVGQAAKTGHVSVLLNRGDGTFRHFTDVVAGKGDTWYPEVADVNHDRRPDILVDHGAVDVLLGNGDGTFQPPVNFWTGAGAPFGSADLNHDGYTDLVVPRANGVAVLLNDGNWTPPVPPPFSGRPAEPVPAPSPDDGRPAEPTRVRDKSTDVAPDKAAATVAASLPPRVPAAQESPDAFRVLQEPFA